MTIDLPANPEPCARCGWNLVPSNRWRAWTPTQREQATAANFRPKMGHGHCRICSNTLRRAGARLPTRIEREAEQERIRTERLEDVTFMAEHGESLESAAHRLGLTEDALHTFLIRCNQRELANTMRRRNPHDHNAPANRTAVVSDRRDRSERQRRGRESVAA